MPVCSRQSRVWGRALVFTDRSGREGKTGAAGLVGLVLCIWKLDMCCFEAEGDPGVFVCSLGSGQGCEGQREGTGAQLCWSCCGPSP